MPEIQHPLHAAFLAKPTLELFEAGSECRGRLILLGDEYFARLRHPVRKVALSRSLRGEVAQLRGRLQLGCVRPNELVKFALRGCERPSEPGVRLYESKRATQPSTVVLRFGKRSVEVRN